MTKHEEFNQLMKLCRVETVFIASVTDRIKLTYTKLPSRNGLKEHGEGFRRGARDGASSVVFGTSD